MSKKVIVEVFYAGPMTVAVEGVAGPGCLSLTDWADKLGDVKTERTPDFDRQPEVEQRDEGRAVQR